MGEDCLQCNYNDILLLLILPQHPSFQTASALQLHDGGVFFSVDVQVVKNPIQELLVTGGYNMTAFLELFSFRGGSSLALRFVHVKINGFKLKFANIFYSHDSIQICGIQKDIHNLKGQLKKMNDPG